MDQQPPEAAITDQSTGSKYHRLLGVALNFYT